MTKFSICLTVVCTGVIIFAVIENGIRTREKIAEEMEALRKSLAQQKSGGQTSGNDQQKPKI